MKKLNKFFAVLVALAMMATLCVCMAFAAPAEQSTDVSLAVLTKDFQVPEGVTSPAATFNYAFAVQSQPTAASVADFDEDLEIATGTGDQLGLLFLKNVFDYDADGKLANTSMLTAPGEYVFLVSENDLDHGSEFTPVNANANEDIDMDDAVYTLRVYVARNDDGLYVKDITVQTGAPVVLDEDNPDLDTPEEVQAANDGAKVDPDDDVTTDDNDTPEDPSDDIVTHNGSDFKFTNTYSKTLSDDPGDNDDPSLQNAAVAIDKTVTGSGDVAATFPFTVNITLPEEMKDDENAQTFTATYPGGTVTLTVPAGSLTATAQSFNLANGQALKFATFPAGATLTVTETAASSAAQYANQYTGGAAGLGAGTTYDKGETLTYTTAAVNAQGKVAVTNNLDEDDVTPTGILINNLPYIALALVAIGGLIAYVVVRRRNADEA